MMTKRVIKGARTLPAQKIAAGEYEYDFTTPLAPRQTIRSVGSEISPEDTAKLACESAKAPPDCAALKRNGYQIKWPAGFPTLAPLSGEGPRIGAADGCWAQLVMYADGTGWSVSPM
jgi:hypothetical protein